VRWVACIVLLSVAGSLTGCVEHDAAMPAREPTTLWPAADSLFQRDDSWVGADGAYSIDLGQGRVLWTFGDTWIDPSGRKTRDGATMVSNSVAIQQGYDPEQASMSFFWGNMDTDTPIAFVPDVAGMRFWPGHGAMVGEKLILFWMDVNTVPDGIGFSVTEWRALLVSNPTDEPSAWQLEPLDNPSNDRRIIVGSGGVLVHDGYLYAHGAQEPGPDQAIYLVRWPETDAASGDLTTGMQWWGGEDVGWLSGPNAFRQALPVADNGQTEFTVHYDSTHARFQLTHSSGFGNAVIVGRYAEHITGPWSPPDTLLIPPHNVVPDISIYQGKSHPWSTGDGLVLTYATNSFDFGDHFRNAWLYYPRFALTRPADSHQGAIRTH
jgi:hypothetical protein